MSTFYNKKDGTLEPISTNTQIIDQPANHFLSKEAYDPDGVVEDAGGIEAVAVPTGGTTGQVLTKKSSTDYDVEWRDASGGSDSVATPIDAVRNNNIDSNFEELSYKHDTQAYLRLYIDDARGDLSDMWEILQEYGVVANLAVPTSTLENTANNGQKIKDLLHDMEDAGYEIQSHSIDFNPLTASSTREDAVAMLKDSKETLLKEGYKVYGFCRPGGTNEVKFGTKGFGDLVQQYYLYSDDNSIASSRINDVRAAIGLNATEANIRSIVNATKGASPARKILLHGIGADITEANLRYLITYAQSENIQFVTDYEYYHNHVIGITEDRLKKIESGDLTPYTTFDHFFFERAYGRINYNHIQYPYALVYSTGKHSVFVCNNPVILDTSGSTGKYRRADGEPFTYQRWEYGNCQWSVVQSGTTSAFNTSISIAGAAPLFANFEVVDDTGATRASVENYYQYDGTLPKITIPAGGATRQVLTKKSDSDYAVEWKDVTGGGSEKKGELIEYHATYSEPYSNKSEYQPTITEISDTVVNIVTDGNAYMGAYFTVSVSPNKINAFTMRFNNISGMSSNIIAYCSFRGKSTSMGQKVITTNGTKTDKTFYFSWDDIKDYVNADNLIDVRVYTNGAVNYDVSIEVHYLDGKGVLYGKTVTFLGDSITTENYDWTRLFTLMTESTKIENVAVAGAHFHNYDDTVMDGNPQSSSHSNTLPNQVQKLINNQYDAPDIVIIAAGTNGGINATQTQIDTAYSTNFAELDLTDGAQAFRWCNEKIRALYPNAKIIWCNPIQGGASDKSPQNIVSWGNALRILTAYGAVNNVETNRCGINNSEETISHVYLDDGLHPNFDGSMLMADYNAAAIEHMYI